MRKLAKFIKINLFSSKTVATRASLKISKLNTTFDANDILKPKSNKNATYKDFWFSLFGCSKYKSWCRWKCYKNLYSRHKKFMSYHSEYEQALDFVYLISRIKEIDEISK